MRWLYLLAGFVAVAAALVHAVMGGIETLNPVMAGEIPLEARVATLAVWHLATLLYAFSALALFWAFGVGTSRARPLGLFLAGLYLMAALIFALLGFTWFEDFMKMPQWTLLASIGLLSLWRPAESRWDPWRHR